MSEHYVNDPDRCFYKNYGAEIYCGLTGLRTYMTCPKECQMYRRYNDDASVICDQYKGQIKHIVIDHE